MDKAADRHTGDEWPQHYHMDCLRAARVSSHAPSQEHCCSSRPTTLKDLPGVCSVAGSQNRFMGLWVVLFYPVLYGVRSRNGIWVLFIKIIAIINHFCYCCFMLMSVIVCKLFRITSIFFFFDICRSSNAAILRNYVPMRCVHTDLNTDWEKAISLMESPFQAACLWIDERRRDYEPWR